MVAVAVVEAALPAVVNVTSWRRCAMSRESSTSLLIPNLSFPLRLSASITWTVPDATAVASPASQLAGGPTAEAWPPLSGVACERRQIGGTHDSAERRPAGMLESSTASDTARRAHVNKRGHGQSVDMVALKSRWIIIV